MRYLKQFEKKHNSAIDEKFHQLNIGNIGYVIYWMKFLEKISEIPGDIVECGIGRGRSLITISALNFLLDKREGGGRTIFAYDSFEGFPEPSLEDKSLRHPQKGEWSSSPSGKYKYTKDFIKVVLTEAGIPLDDTKLYIRKGFFSDSLKKHPNSAIALLHVDGDLYQSYKDTLENLYGLVSKGGIIVFDDFLTEKKENESFPGARIAVERFLGEKINKLKTSIAGTPFFIKDE